MEVEISNWRRRKENDDANVQVRMGMGGNYEAIYQIEITVIG